MLNDIVLMSGANGLLLLIVVIVIVSIFLSSKKDDPDISILSNQSNKVINVSMTGGIIGMLSGSPKNALNSKIQAENAEGWRVVQILPAESGNLLHMVLRLVLLFCTLFLYTTSNGYYVVMEKEKAEKEKDTKMPDILKCLNCGKEYSSTMKGYFCDECGHKL